MNKSGLDNYEIDGLKISSSSSYENGRYAHATYEGFLYKISVAKDDMGTQICYNGRFFGGSFTDMNDAVEYLRQNKEEAIKFFRGAYIARMKRKLSRKGMKRYARHTYWRIRHHFQPDFYL